MPRDCHTNRYEAFTIRDDIKLEITEYVKLREIADKQSKISLSVYIPENELKIENGRIA